MSKETEVIKFLKDLYPNETIRIFSDTTMQQLLDQALDQQLKEIREWAINNTHYEERYDFRFIFADELVEFLDLREKKK